MATTDRDTINRRAPAPDGGVPPQKLDKPSTPKYPEQPDPLDEEILDRVVRECPL